MSLSVELYFVSAVALIGAGTVWFIQQSGDPVTRMRRGLGGSIKSSTKSRRDELTEARARIERQIEVLRAPAGGPSLQNAPPDLSAEIAELQALLDGINRELS